MHWLYYIALMLVMLCGLVLNLFTLPGNWLMLAAVVVYAWATGWQHTGRISLLVLFGLALAAEVLEFFAAGAGTKKAGGSAWGIIGGICGGIAGGILFTPLIPIPILSTLAAIILGTFFGALAGEVMGGKQFGQSTLIGLGAARGRLYGTVLKLAFGGMILIIGLYLTFPLSPRPSTTPVVPPPVMGLEGENSNDEIRMTNQTQNPKSETKRAPSSFRILVIRI